MASEVSPISSRKRVPPSASLKSPLFSLTAPVKAPLSWPKSSDSRRFSGRAPQLIETNGRAARAEVRWMARAMSPFPVPDSPVMRTVEVVRPILSTMSKTARIRRETPTSGPSAGRSSTRLLRTTFSSARRFLSSALPTTCLSSSTSKGLET